MKSDNKRNITRRTFIQSTAAGVMGMGAVAAFSCAETKSESNKNEMVTLEILEPQGELAFP
jgi:hypothetical protein